MTLRRTTTVVTLLLVLGASACENPPEDGAAPPDACEETRQIDEAWGDHLIPGDDTDVWVVGDSWTMGWPLEDPTTSWVATFADRTGYTVHVDGWSGSGYTVSGLCPGDTTFPARVARAAEDEPDLVVIQGGLNDAGVREEDLAAAVAEAVEAAEGTDVVLLGPALAPVLPADSVRAVDAVLRAAAEDAENVRHVSALDWSLDYFPDQAHPSSEGARELGELAAEAVKGSG